MGLEHVENMGLEHVENMGLEHVENMGLRTSLNQKRPYVQWIAIEPCAWTPKEEILSDPKLLSIGYAIRF